MLARLLSPPRVQLPTHAAHQPQQEQCSHSPQPTPPAWLAAAPPRSNRPAPPPARRSPLAPPNATTPPPPLSPPRRPWPRSPLLPSWCVASKGRESAIRHLRREQCGLDRGEERRELFSPSRNLDSVSSFDHPLSFAYSLRIPFFRVFEFSFSYNSVHCYAPHLSPRRESKRGP